MPDENPGAVTRTVTRLPLIEALQQAPPGLAEAELADAILERLPEAPPQVEPGPLNSEALKFSGRDLADGVSIAVAERDAEVAELRAMVAEYEHRISWATNCGEHARLLTALAEVEAERDRLRSGGRELGRIVTRQVRSMRAARIEMLQSGPEKAMRWILSSLPDVDDNPEAEQWDGKESAAEWLDRTDEKAEVARDDH